MTHFTDQGFSAWEDNQMKKKSLAMNPAFQCM